MNLDRGTPLIHAIMNDQVEAVKLFIRNGADASINDLYGNFSLVYAIDNCTKEKEQACSESIRMLVKAGVADPQRQRDLYGQSVNFARDKGLPEELIKVISRR